MRFAHFPPADRVIVAYSGGKDSMMVADLAVQRVPDVKLFYMYFIPGLDYSDYWCNFAAKRWKVEVLQVQHFDTGYLLANGYFCEPVDDVPSLTITDIEAHVRAQLGEDWLRAWIAYGYRMDESLERRGMLNSWGPKFCYAVTRRCAPIAQYRAREVYAYLQRRRLPIPAVDDVARTSGVSLEPRMLNWMRTAWPDDYRRILRVFPHAIAQADRYDRYKEEWRARRHELRTELRAARQKDKVSKVRL